MIMWNTLYLKTKLLEIYLMKRKLKSDILFKSLSILSISIVLIIIYTYGNDTKTTFHLAQSYIKSSTTQLKDKINRILTSTESMVNLYVPILVDSDLRKISKDINFINSIQSMLEANEQISTVYYGTPDGYFLEFAAPKMLEPYMTRLGLKIPENTTTLMKEIINQPVMQEGQNEISDYWFYVRSGKTISEPRMGEKTGYDPRRRNWYIESSKTQNLVWSPIYIFSSTLRGESGITVSKSMFDSEGQFKGVFAADISLKSMSEFLAKSKISPNSEVYVVNEKREIVASSTLKSNVVVKGNNLGINTAEDLQDKVLIEAMKNKQKDQNFASFNLDGKDYIAYYDNFTKLFQNDWQAIAVSPVDEFVGQVKQNRNNTFKYSLIILLVSFILTYRLARRISGPIVALAEEAAKIQELDLNGKINIHSKIHEINDLAHAMSSLKTTMQSFSYYIPKTLVKQLINRKQSIHVGGKMKEVTLMFTDIENFTSVSEVIPPEKLVIYLSEYFEEVSKIIMSCSGTVDKYIGDAVMAFWGAPINDRHHVLNACHAALKLQHKLSELNRVWKREGRPVFETRIGLHVGEVIIGNMGSSERMNYTAIGDSVNLCSRLEGLNKNYGTSIIVSENIYTVVKESFLFRQIDLVAVKGKSKAVKIYELVAQVKGDNSLLPTDEQLDFCQSFDRAYKLFLTRQWEEALESFKRLNPPRHMDKTISLYVFRCKQYLIEPPSKEWDGTVIFTEK